MKRFSPIVFQALMLFYGTFVHGQQRDTIVETDNKRITLPEIGINFGIANLTSDVALQAPGPNPFSQFGFQLTITQRVAKYLNLSLNIFTGTVYGEDQRGLTNLNYRTTLFSQQLNIEYNFYPLLKPDAQGRQLLRPYIGVGGGAMFFRSKGDLKAVGGETYHYWSDGTIRTLAEGDGNAESALILQRDMEYESDLRDANLDGLRKYPQTAFTLPFHAGIRIQFSKHFGANAAFTYALNFSDMLDNSGANSLGARTSSSGNDHHFFGSVGLNFFFGNVRFSTTRTQSPEMLVLSENKWKPKGKAPKKEIAADSGQEISTDAVTADGEKAGNEGENESEGITTSTDTSSSSIADSGAALNAEAEANSSRGSTKEDTQKGAEGKGKVSPVAAPSSGQDEVIQDRSVQGSERNEYSAGTANDEQKKSGETASFAQADGGKNGSEPSKQPERNAGQLTLSELEKAPPKATGTFHWADRDKNGLISASEVLFFIDQLFEGDGKLTVEDIQNLIDYYFDQE